VVVAAAVEVRATVMTTAMEMFTCHPILHMKVLPVMALLRCTLILLRDLPANGSRAIDVTSQYLHRILCTSLPLRTISPAPLRMIMLLTTNYPTVGRSAAIAKMWPSMQLLFRVTRCDVRKLMLRSNEMPYQTM